MGTSHVFNVFQVADSQEDVEEEGALTVDDLPAKLNVNPVPKVT